MKTETPKNVKRPLAMLAVALLTGAAAIAIAKTDWKKGALSEPMPA